MKEYFMKKYLKEIWAAGLSAADERKLEKIFDAGKNFPVQIKIMDAEGTKRLLQEKIKTAETDGVLLFSGDAALLRLAKDGGIAALGYVSLDNTKRGGANGEFLPVKTVAEGIDGTDALFFERVYERCHGIPWTILETERCLIRELKLSDLDELFEMYAEKGMTDYIEPLYAYEKEREYQKAYIENMYGFYGYGMWLVFEKKSGRLIGRAGIEHREELGGGAELGYAIRPSCQRMGYASEVCAAIIGCAKEEFAIGRLHCLIQEGNLASEKFAVKIGFSRAGTLSLDGVLMSDYVRTL